MENKQEKQDGNYLVKAAEKLGLQNPEEVISTTRIVATFCSWAKDMSPLEIMGTVVKARSMGVNPTNPYEFKAWKDKRGIINSDYAYTLYLEWLRRIGEYTSPKFYRLLDEELEAEMLEPGDFALRVKFIMHADLPLLQMGLERDDIEKTGLGVMTKYEMDKLGKFAAPNGRSVRWKVEKRALIDAIRRNFGTPNPAEVAEIKAEKKWDILQPEDFAQIEGLADGDTLALAEATAQRREMPMLEDEEREEAVTALFG